MRYLNILCWIIFLPLFGYSQDTVISVRDALNMAMQNNPELNRLEEQIRVQESYVGGSWGIDSPELYYFEEGLDGSTFSEQRWGISQTMAFPLTGYYQHQKAKYDVETVELQVEASRKQIRAEVKKAYTELAYSIKFVELVQREVELAEELQEIAQARLEVGESTELDLIRAEIQFTQAQNDLRRAGQMKDAARYSLFRVIGLDPDQQLYGISYPDTLSFIEIEIDQDEVLQRLDETPVMRSVLQHTKSAGKNIQVAKSSYLPELRVDYYRQDFGGGFEFNGFEVGISIPLWFGLNERNNVKRANAELRRAQWSVNETSLQIKERAENAWHSYETSRESILSHRDFIQARSSTLLELTSEGYRLGELDLLRVLEAQRTFLEGQQNYYQALKNYYLQIIELERYLPNELVFIN
jgi:outer membrane protein, heavy metal efflux system